MPGLLDAFFFSFEADTTKVKEGVDSGKKGSEALEKSLLNTDLAAKKLGSSFVDIAKNAAQLIVGTLAIGALKSISIASGETTAAFEAENRALRWNITEIDQWGKAAVAGGGSAGEFTKKLKELKDDSKDPIEDMMKLADKFKGLNDEKADKLGDKLGLGPGLVEAMRGGREGLQALLDRQKLLGLVTKEQAEVAKKYKDQMRDTGTVYDDIKRKIATEVLPYLTSMGARMEKIAIWARDNKTFVLGFFGAVAALLLAFYLPAVISATVATFAFLAPFLLIGAAVAAVGAIFALVFDDVMAFLDGNNSVIGKLAERWPIVGEAVHALADTFKFLWTTAKAVFAGIGDLIMSGPTVAFNVFAGTMEAAIDTLLSKFPGLASVFQTVGSTIVGTVDTISSAWNGLLAIIQAVVNFAVGAANKVMGVVNAVSGFFGGGADKSAAGGQAGIMNIGKDQLAQVNANPLNSQTSNSISNSKATSKNTTVNVGEVKVQTAATDADGISKGVAKGLGDQLRSASDQYNDGVIG